MKLPQRPNKTWLGKSLTEGIGLFTILDFTLHEIYFDCVLFLTCEDQSVGGGFAPQLYEVHGVSETQGRVPSEHNARRLHLISEAIYSGI